MKMLNYVTKRQIAAVIVTVISLSGEPLVGRVEGLSEITYHMSDLRYPLVRYYNNKTRTAGHLGKRRERKAHHY